MSKRKILRLTVAVAAILGLTSCGDDQVQDVPVPGWLVLSLSTPNSDDGGILFTVSGAALDSVRSGHPHVLKSGEGSASTRIIIAGSIAGGTLAEIKVPDTRNAAQYSVSIDQVVARGTYAQRPPAGYTLTVVKPAAPAR